MRAKKSSVSKAASILAKKGGDATKKKYGKKHFSKMGKANLKKHGVEFYRTIRRIGALKRGEKIPKDKGLQKLISKDSH